MNEMKLGVVEGRFADLIWENAPITSGDLVRLCQKEFDWKRTTTYTVLKRLCDRGLFKNENGTVSVCINKEEYYAMQSEQVVSENFGGSLPAFIAAFTKRKKLSDEDVAEIEDMIRAMREGKLQRK